MEIINVKVKVDQSELDSAISKINGANGKGTTVKIDTKEATANVKELTKQSQILGDSLGNIVLKMAAWQVIGGLVAAPIRAFKEAVNTLKEVDSALVTVQKTTGYSKTQLEDLTEQTYELASAYGRTADELLNMSATFARAGFKDQLVQMTELAALLQNVGDLEEDTAAKFLLAANAAWQLGGDYDSLMSIIDGMNEVTNQAAVDMEALTTGITVAGSVFANAGETAQTYTALVGTAVASTQRSGSEIARGLRTIAMNVRAIKGELDDGEIIDEDTISDAAAALSSVGISVADINGELRLTSDVLSDLAGKWDSLTSGEQSYIAQSLAGKRQANVLTALMQNWSEVERQMQLYADGAGSALKENEIYLDSWEAKSKQLDATWTQFVSHLIETDTVKGALDALTGAVEFLDSGFGKVAVSVTAAVAGVVALKSATDGLSASISKLGESIAANPYLAIAAAAAAIVVGSVTISRNAAAAAEETAKALKDQSEASAQAATNAARNAGELSALILKYEEMSEITDKTQEQEDEYQDSLSAINDLLGDRKSALEGLTAGTEEYTAALHALTEEEMRQAEISARRSVYEAEQAIYGLPGTGNHTGDYATDYSAANAIARAALSKYGFYREDSDTGTTYIGYDVDWSDLEQIISYYYEMIDAREELNDLQAENPDIFGVTEYKELDSIIEFLKPYIEALEEARTAQEELAEVAREAADAQEEELGAIEKAAQTARSAASTVDELKEQVSALTAASKEYNEYGGLTASTLEKLEALFPGITNALYDVNGNLTETAQQALTTAGGLAAVAAEFINVAENGRNLSLADARRELEALQNMAFQTSGSLALIAELQGMIAGGEQQLNNITVHIEGAGTAKTGGSSGGTKTDTRKTGYEEKLKLLQSQLTLMQAQGASVEEQAAKMREIQDALHEEAEYLRTTKEYLDGDASAIAEVNGLSSDWWSWNEKILKLMEDQEQQLLDNAAAVRDEMLASLDAEIEALKTAHDTKEDQLKLEEKILAVQKAQADLANAQAERTVRYYNALTGQWEWGADAQKVKAAQEALASAQSSLSEYQSEQAYNAQIDRLNARKDSVNSLYDSLGSMSDAQKIARMKANSAAWHSADAAERARLNQENQMIAASMGATYNAAEGRYYLNGQPLYDSGGILRGVGGIKATRRDEIILPPDVTQAMLTPMSSKAYSDRLDDLRWLYEGKRSGKVGGGSSIGSMHNGDVYEMNGYTLTTEQAQRTTVYELAQLARTLKTRSSTN